MFFMVSPCCRAAVAVVAAFVDRIPLNVDFICIFVGKFVTLHYSYKAFKDGSVYPLRALALSTGSAVQSCEEYCGLYGVASCSYYLHDGREVCRSVVE